ANGNRRYFGTRVRQVHLDRRVKSHRIARADRCKGILSPTEDAGVTSPAGHLSRGTKLHDVGQIGNGGRCAGGAGITPQPELPSSPASPASDSAIDFGGARVNPATSDP